MDTRMNTKRILIFLVFAFGIPWTAVLVLYLTIGVNDPRIGGLANIFALTGPGLANVATRLITREGRRNLRLRPNFRGGWRFYLAAWLLPFLAVILGGTIYYLLFPQSFDANLEAARNAVASIPSLVAANSWTLILISTMNALIIGLVYHSSIAIGEEFGWRAYLLPKLMERFTGAEPASGSAEETVPADLYTAGARKAALLIGVIWGVWHWPGDIIAIMINPGTPIFLLLVRLVSSCSLSVLLCWVTLRSRSVWPASIGHGLFNATIQLSWNMLKGPPNVLLGPQSSGLIGGLGFLALALVLLFSRRAFVGGKQPAGSGNLQTKEYSTLV